MLTFAHGAQQRCDPSSWRQNNAIGACAECTRHTVLFKKYQCAEEHPLFCMLTLRWHLCSLLFLDTKGAILVPLGLATPITPARVLGADDSRAIGKVTFTLLNAALPKPESLVSFNGSQEELRSFIAALLLHLSPLIAWILKSAPTHFAPLSNARKKEVKDAELTFYDAYGDVGTMLAQQHILEIRIRVFQDLLPPTTHSMRSDTWYNYGSSATTDVCEVVVRHGVCTLFWVKPKTDLFVAVLGIKRRCSLRAAA